jgi:hypothetical protein
MKKRILLLAIPLILAGCAEQSNNSGLSSSSSDPASSSEEVSSSSNDGINFVSTSTYADKDVSVSGILSDLNFCKYVIKDKKYQCTITAKNETSSDVKVSFSNVGIVTFVGDLETGFTLNCLKVGGTIMTIKDSSDFMIYRTAINVREPLTAEKVTDYMVNSVTYYDAPIGYDHYKISFTSPTAGVFTAKEGDNDYGSMTFTYAIDSELVQFIDLYGYNLTVTMDDSKSAILMTTIFVYGTGNSLMAYEKNGIIGIFEEVI